MPLATPGAAWQAQVPVGTAVAFAGYRPGRHAACHWARPCPTSPCGSQEDGVAAYQLALGGR
ncbi:MAG: hypothetical protein WKG07_33070 [Hymenobacter sp.]